MLILKQRSQIFLLKQVFSSNLFTSAKNFQLAIR